MTAVLRWNWNQLRFLAGWPVSGVRDMAGFYAPYPTGGAPGIGIRGGAVCQRSFSSTGVRP